MRQEEKEYYDLVKRVFRVLAPFYDVITAPISGLRHDVLKFANARKGSRVLDVATGTGAQAFAFAEKGYGVTGVDISEDMLAIAQRKNKYPNARLLVADATRLPFAAAEFDVACISFALHDMPLSIQEKVLKEMVRVTKPGGTIIVADYALPKSAIGRFVVYNFVKLYEGKYYRQFIRSDFDALLERAGIAKNEEIPVLHGAGRIVKGMRK
jgi:demethylmenaquinone methyltransferase/2-methoxy-6-polyprenyl-1,4-benzoquinol methylase